MKKTIFVTGANGFIGKNFIEFIGKVAKYTLLYPSHKELDLLSGKQVDNFFSKNKVDIVIHCANRGGVRTDKSEDRVVSENLRIFFNIMKNKKKFGRMIYFGSGAEYDKLQDIKKVKEEDFGRSIPSDAYGFYKYICSKYTENAKDIVCLRLFGVFGKYENSSVRFISNMIVRYIKKKSLKMIQNARFDYIDVIDLCRIVEYFISHKPKRKFYNVGSGTGRELLTIAKNINLLDSYSQEITIQKKGLNKEYTCNNRRLMSEIKGFKFTSFTKSLKSLYEYYKTEFPPSRE